MLATIYARFSSAEQAKGSSIARQLDLCETMAREQGWEISDIIREEGKSAFSGANRAKGGKLHAFEQQVDKGQYGNGHVLIVEHLDRITRQGWEQVLPFLQNLTAKGVTIATVDSNRIYPAGVRVEMVPVIEAILKSEVAREESKKKSDRGRKSWEMKRESAITGSGKAITSTTPAWIAVDPQTREMRLIPERVEILKTIFQLAIDGRGAPLIAKQLNEEKLPSWSGSGCRWDTSYISKILVNRAVLGEFSPMRAMRNDQGKRINKATGDIIDGYYPAAIDREIFEKALAARAVRKRSGGAWATTANNVLSGIVKCAECGGGLIYVMGKKKGVPSNYKSRNGVVKQYVAKENSSYLYCNNASHSKSDDSGEPLCTNDVFIRYEHYEAQLFKYLLSFVAEDEAPKPADETRVKQAELVLAAKDAQLANLVDSYSRTGSSAIEKRLLELETEVASDRAALDKLKREDTIKRATPTRYSDLVQVLELQDAIESDDDKERVDARIKLRQSLKRLVDSMTLDSDRQLVTRIGKWRFTVRFEPKQRRKAA